jgi:mono/diheme cytochrome c family protein
MLADRYQKALIVLAISVTFFLGIFVYREIFPEYKIYQNRYVEMEKFRSSYTGDPVPPFKGGVAQIVIAKADLGPEDIDRCVSCHVALKLTHFSPTKVATDVNGHVALDANGYPQMIPNNDYVWGKLDEKIALLRKEGNEGEAVDLEELKSVEVGEHTYDLTKVLAMHPLIGKETRPFQYHAMEDFGCTSCHGGNGRGLVTDRAHGPVYDGQYEPELEGEEPEFLEHDEENDPKFAKVFNHKPGHRLLFQTKPILTGGLLQAKCMECHKTSQGEVSGIVQAIDSIASRQSKEGETIKSSLKNDERAVASLIDVMKQVLAYGIEGAEQNLRLVTQNFRSTPQERDIASGKLSYLQQIRRNNREGVDLRENVLKSIQFDLENLVGSPALVQALVKRLDIAKVSPESEVAQFVADSKDDPDAQGVLFKKQLNVARLEKVVDQISFSKTPIEEAAGDRELIHGIRSETDRMTRSYQRGKELFFSQACYACHRIAGFARGGVGPELTQIGLNYPWYVKESIVWPQANLKSSTMPNFRMDHEEVENLLTYLMTQRGTRQSEALTEQRLTLSQWEQGAKMPWEKPISPKEIQDTKVSMVTFGTEGCASCHRLKGFTSTVGYTIERENPAFEKLLKEREWFTSTFPETIVGSRIVAMIDKHGKEIDARIENMIHSDGALEEIERQKEKGLEAFYSPFKYAMRAKNYELDEKLLAAAGDDAARSQAFNEHQEYLDRVRKVMMMYIHEYGFGRQIGPNLHYSGVYRDEQWLIQHFRNPSSHVAKSIMPVFPFDDTKFYMLTRMLQELGRHNRDQIRQVWGARGFSPEIAYNMHCAVCHGEYMHGNGVIADWIYPIPKNLRDGTFLRNLTKERAKQSIVHGVKGTPMPPWGEAPASTDEDSDGQPVLTEAEVDDIVNWIFQALPGGEVIQDDSQVPKWKYMPGDVYKELQDEGSLKQFKNSAKPVKSEVKK